MPLALCSARRFEPFAPVECFLKLGAIFDDPPVHGGKWTPLKLIAIVSLARLSSLVIEGDHTANGLNGKRATKPCAVMP
jgi:hypothetical protein